MDNKDHLRRVFWFCCYVFNIGILLLAALIWIPVPNANQSISNIAIGFVTGSIISVPVTYIFGGNIPQNKKSDTPPAGTTTADISATVTTVNDAPKEESKATVNE